MLDRSRLVLRTTARSLGPFSFLLLVPYWAHADIVRSVDQNGVVTLRNTSSGRRSSPARATSGPDARTTGHPAIDRYRSIVDRAASLYQIPRALILAVISVESGFDPRAVSPADARGLMQLMPATAERMQVSDIFDARQNIYGGTRYLRILANLFNGDLTLTLAGYNAGEAAILRYGGVPPYRETREYVTKVVSTYRRYQAVGY